MINHKIIHIDMDCFYAAIEIRDNPELINKPVAVGGTSQRSVLCTCNYIARKFGVHSAMSSQIAKSRCPDLIIIPVNMSKYKKTAKIIHNIFHEFTDLVEPLALDEAYLDVTNNQSHNNSATLIARDIQKRIWEEVSLTASAGVAPNKFLAKVASGWNKPNGLFVISPPMVNQFVANLPVQKIFGVGKVTLIKLHHMNIKTCADLQTYTLAELINKFGKFGHTLYNQSRGIDLRAVEPDRPRKSLSVETTFITDIDNHFQLQNNLLTLYDKLQLRLNDMGYDYKIKNQFVKVKFNNFKVKSVEISSHSVNLETFIYLLKSIAIINKIRLLGIGVHFDNNNRLPEQLQLF
ncbi:MAG: dinB [Burkholderiales bacterium]|jgi:DNA polymerase-4|nr:dinB [Burkholderiales bacterium]